MITGMNERTEENEPAISSAFLFIDPEIRGTESLEK